MPETIVGRIYRLFAAALAAGVVCAQASPITYTLSGSATGTINGVPFSNAAFTASGVGDTATVTPCGSPIYCNNMGPVTFTIAGVGSGTVTDSLFIFANNGVQAVGFQRSGSNDWIDAFDARLATYQLATAIGPITATSFIVQGQVNTTMGVLVLNTSSPINVFKATFGGATPPSITLTPASLTFAPRTIGTTSPTQTVTLTNNGPASLTIASIAVSGDFAFTSACGATLAAGATCTIDVSSTPLVVGPRSGSLTITSNASGSPHTVALSGQGQPVPVGILEVSPTSLDFGTQPSGSTSPPQLLSLHNAGNATLNRGPESVDGDFRLLTGTDADQATQNQTCGAAIAPGATCKLALVFTPTATGTRTGAIALPNDGSTPVVTARLAGTGAVAEPPRSLTVTPSIFFGDQLVGTRSDGRPVTITNRLATPAAITDMSVDNADFLVSDACTTIPANGSCSALVVFRPTVVGNARAILTIRDFGETQPYTTALSGVGVFNGVGEIELSSTGIGFGNVLVGSSRTLGFRITNVGLVPVVFGSMLVKDDFIISGDCPSTLPVGTSCGVQVTFLPRIVGVHAATLDIFSNAANSPRHVDLSGAACAFPTPGRSRVLGFSCGR